MTGLVESVPQFTRENAQCDERSHHIGRAIQNGFIQFRERWGVTNVIAMRVRHQQKINFPEGADIGLERRWRLRAAGQPWINHESFAARCLDPKASLPQPQNFRFRR